MEAITRSDKPIDTWLGRIYAGWADFFACSPVNFTSRGTLLLTEESNRDTGNVYIWDIGPKTIVEVDPVMLSQVAAIVPADSKLNIKDLRLFFGADRIVLDHSETIYYLYPADFKSAVVPGSFVTRPLGLADQSSLATLVSACTAEEVDDAWIQIDQPYLVGCFHQDQLVSVASISDTWKKLVDIGVLTHPDYRRLGLGKAVVSKICEREIESNRIPQYRSVLKLTGSHQVARSLGFAKYFEVTSLTIQAP